MIKVNENILQKYAELIIKVGVNVQPGQLLYIQADTHSDFFVKYVVEEAYKAKAGKVLVDFNMPDLARLAYQYQSVEQLKDIPQFALDKLEYLMDQKGARLKLLSDIPGYLEGIDPNKIQADLVYKMSLPTLVKMKDYSMNNETQWCLAAVPNQRWAELIFPNDDHAYEKLWDAILYACRVTEDNHPVLEWAEHNQYLQSHNRMLNDYNFKSLVFKNSLGTDIEVGLVKDHVWAGGSEHSLEGVVFNPNIPTEESFTMPDRLRVNGKVYATKPLDFNGVLIDKFWVEFKDGKVVDFDAKENREALENLLNVDEGARHIGEIALISHVSPISDLNILFYNTLFDENASCHMALGAAYPMNIKGGSSMNQEELLAHHANVSTIHVDFMFGSADMSVIGLTYDGQEVVVFKDGNFVF